MTEKIKRCFSLFLICVCMILLLFPAQQSYAAAQQQVVRVGWFSQPGFQETDENGKPYGYNYEYLMRIAQKNNWAYQFVQVDSFAACYTMLQQGTVDVMGCVMDTAERRNEVAFPKKSSGTTYTSLFVDVGSEIVLYDFEAFDGMRVGCRVSQNPEELLQYAADNGFTVTLVYYDNVESIEAAVASGEIDAGVMGGYQETENTRIVASFAPVPFYFVTTKDNTSVLQGLEKALQEIAIENPFYEKELYYKYLPQTKNTLLLTQKEQEYLDQNHEFTVSYNSDFTPLEMSDPKTGQFTGIVADVLARVSELTGITFHYEADAKDADIIGGFTGGFDDADAAGYDLTHSYLNVPMVVVRREDDDAQKSGSTAAIDSYYLTNNNSEMTENEVLFCDTPQECLDAVALGRTEQAFVNAYSADSLLSKAAYEKLKASTLYGSSYDISMAVKKENEAELFSVLNKALSQISESELNAIILKNTVKPQEITLQGIIEQMPADVILVIAILLVAIIAVLILLLRGKAKYARNIREVLYRDDLTGLYNQRGFCESIQNILENNPESQYYLIDFDVNSFKEYNSIHGYAIGDRLLAHVAKILKQCLGTGEIAARVQADHFLCLMTAENLQEIQSRIKQFDAQFHMEMRQSSLLVSYGIYEITNKNTDVVTMCDCAIVARRAVKGNYEHFIGIYDNNLYQRQLSDAALIGKFNAALASGELKAYYQPQYNVYTKKIAGAEALVRWICKDGSMIMPARFIDLLEQNGLIGKLDLYMFEQVCQKVKEMRCRYGRPIPLSVNVSRAQMYDDHLTEKLLGIIKKYDIPASAVELELTESAFLENLQEMMKTMAKLHEAGFRLAIDDFGSGYSGLNMLKDINFDTVKLDRGFLIETEGDKRGDVILQGILALAKKLNLQTIAEGVETKAQFLFLKENGCDMVQGFYFSRAVPGNEFDRMIEEENNEGKHN
ncbi:MAG: EAL domain-containing protein [Christensenella sp.]|nr:EAL domain-containing protein [Christensenella sp.]